MPKAKANFRIAIITSQFNENVTHGLQKGALTYLAEQGVKVAKDAMFMAPGAFEIPLMAKALAKTGAFDGDRDDIEDPFPPIETHNGSNAADAGPIDDWQPDAPTEVLRNYQRQIHEDDLKAVRAEAHHSAY